MTHVTNPLSFAISEFDGYAFNAMAKIGDKLFGTSPTGLYQLDIGGLDGAAQIDAVIATGETDFGSPHQKRVSDFYIGMRSDDVLEVTADVDEAASGTYPLDPLGIGTIKQRRAHIGKGLKGKYWKFTVANTGGCDFDIDSLDIAAVVVARRL
jgi:hypothetical protein